MGYVHSYTSGASVDEATQALVAGMAGVKGCSVAATPPGTIVVTRTYRPGWAIALAIVTSILFLVGLLFLLITRTEALTVRITPEGRGSRLSIAGASAHELIVRLNATLRSLPDLRDLSGAPAELSDPVVVEPVGIMGGQGTPAAAAPPPAAGPVAAPVITAVPLVTTEAPRGSAPGGNVAADGRACAGCGRALDPDDQFCGTCGAAAPVACDTCAAELYEGDTFCTACGQAVATA